MTREARFALFLAGVMLLSTAVAASADPKIHHARSAERTMARTRQQLADEQERKHREAERKAAEAKDECDGVDRPASTRSRCVAE